MIGKFFFSIALFFLCTFFLCTPGQQNSISVLNFGAKGDGITDDTDAFVKALNHCIANNLRCSVPKTKQAYQISSTIRVSLEPGQSLQIISDGAMIRPLRAPTNQSGYNLTLYKEHVFLSIGKQIDDLKSEMMDRSKNTSVSITGLVFDGSYLKGKFAATSFDTDIYIGLQVLAENVKIDRCNFKNIYGYGLRVHNVKYSQVTNCRFENVGGRGATEFAQKVDRDALGDGIYHSLVKNNGMVKIEKCIIQGKKQQNKRSRSGVTFEYSTHPYQIVINNSSISGFAKGIHIEEVSPTIVRINNVKMTDLNIGIANVLNNQSKIYFDKLQMDIGLNDGNESGDALAFLNYQSKAQVFVDHSFLNFHGRNQAYQSVSGLVKVRNSKINGNQTNFFFADGNTIFENCIFVHFGGEGKSFYSLDNSAKYQILNSKFISSPSVHAKGEKITLKIINSNN